MLYTTGVSDSIKLNANLQFFKHLSNLQTKHTFSLIPVGQILTEGGKHGSIDCLDVRVAIVLLDSLGQWAKSPRMSHITLAVWVNEPLRLEYATSPRRCGLMNHITSNEPHHHGGVRRMNHITMAVCVNETHHLCDVGKWDTSLRKSHITCEVGQWATSSRYSETTLHRQYVLMTMSPRHCRQVDKFTVELQSNHFKRE